MCTIRVTEKIVREKNMREGKRKLREKSLRFIEGRLSTRERERT